MFDVGLWEILLILVLALVVIGPERLPGAARQAGLFVGKARRYIEGVRSEVESELDINEFKRMLHNQEVQINELQQQIKTGVDDLKPDVSAADILTDTASHSFYDESSDTLDMDSSTDGTVGDDELENDSSGSDSSDSSVDKAAASTDNKENSSSK